MEARELIAYNVARQFYDGELVNLGIGIPTLAVKHLPQGVSILTEGENGSIGIERAVKSGEPGYDDDIVDASGVNCTVGKNAVFLDSLQSFSLIRSGRLMATVLGAMEVDQEGNLANWAVPGKMIAGMGGAMDLVVGAREVIIAMEHCTKKGQPKILKRCTLPLTAEKVCTMIITELCILRYTARGLTLVALAPGVSAEEVQSKTEAALFIPETVGVMESL